MRISRHAVHPQAGAALAVGLIALPVLAAGGHPAASHTAAAVRPPPVPGLAITITDGRVAVTPGERLTYTLSVRDTGAAAVPHLKITQTLSPGLDFLSASGKAAATAGQIAWSAGLPAGGTRTFHVVARVTRTPAHVARLAAVACATLPGSSQPIVCAAHLDRLPAATAQPTAGSGTSGGNPLVYVAAGLAGVAVGLLAVLARRRVRLRRRQA